MGHLVLYSFLFQQRIFLKCMRHINISVKNSYHFDTRIFCQQSVTGHRLKRKTEDKLTTFLPSHPLKSFETYITYNLSQNNKTFGKPVKNQRELLVDANTTLFLIKNIWPWKRSPWMPWWQLWMAELNKSHFNYMLYVWITHVWMENLCVNRCF